MKKKKSASILKKFLVFNFTVFAVLGLFTILYLKAIQPNLVKNRVSNHNIIIQNTNDHLQRLNVSFEEESIKTFTAEARSIRKAAAVRRRRAGRHLGGVGDPVPRNRCRKTQTGPARN